MKDTLFDAQIAIARPQDYHSDTDFTDKVMAALTSPEILSIHIRKMNVNKKETFMMKLRHLPKVAIILIAIATLAILTGTTYAIVQTVTNHNSVGVTSSSKNEQGREQLQVSFDSCDAQKKQGTTYELKKDSGLSAEDGANVLQARCDLDVASQWLLNDAATKQLAGPELNFAASAIEGQADTVVSVSNSTIQLKTSGNKPLSTDVRVVNNNKIGSLSDIKPGDTVIYFNPTAMQQNSPAQPTGIVLFRMSLDAKYYNLDLQSYVSTRAACMENPSRTCLKENSINQVVLIVTNGPAQHSIDDPNDTKDVQGRIVSYDSSSIKLDVGAGVIYTLQTTSNILDTYNQTTVYGLANRDTIYANTDPEALKIKVGDSLDIYYSESDSSADHTINWSQVYTVGLMVERTVQDKTVLEKY